MRRYSTDQTPPPYAIVSQINGGSYHRVQCNRATPTGLFRGGLHVVSDPRGHIIHASVLITA